MSTLDTEGLIARLSGPLNPADRPLFRHDAETALAAPQCWGDGLIYRTVVPLWRRYFVPLPDMLHEASQHPRRSKLIDAPPIARSSRSDEL
jgi:hypothetical protein